MALGKELRVIIVGDASKLTHELGKAGKSAQGFGDRMKHVGKSMTIAGAAITGVAVIVGKDLVDSALKAEVSQAKLEKAFENAGLSAGKYTKQIGKAEDAGRKLGFTNTETRDSLGKLVQGGDSVAQSMTDLALAQDYARATGKDLASATGAIVKVHQGLLRPLKELGISLPQSTENMKALTEAHKKSGTAITYNEKALALQQDKLATGAKAVELMTDKLHGQADAFSSTSAGGMAAFSAQLENLQESLGTLLLPFLDKAVEVLNRVTTALSGLSPETKKLIVDIGLGVAAFGALMLVLGPVIAGIGALLPVFVALASPIGIVVAALVLLTAALVAAVLWPDKLQAGLQRMGLSAKDAKSTVDALRNAFTAIKAVVDVVWPAIEAIIVPSLNVIKGILVIVSALLRGDFSDAWRGVKIVVKNELDLVVGILTGFPRIMLRVATDIGKALFDGFKVGVADLFGYVSDVPGRILSSLGDLRNLLYNAGIQIIQGLINGITDKLGALWGLVGSIAGGIASRKGPITKDRVLLRPHGQAIIEGLMSGMEDRLPDLTRMVSGIAPAIAKTVKKAVVRPNMKMADWAEIWKQLSPEQQADALKSTSLDEYFQKLTDAAGGMASDVGDSFAKTGAQKDALGKNIADFTRSSAASMTAWAKTAVGSLDTTSAAFRDWSTVLRGGAISTLAMGASPSPALSAAASSGGGMAVINTSINLDGTQIAEVVRREYLRFEKRNGRAAV